MKQGARRVRWQKATKEPPVETPPYRLHDIEDTVYRDYVLIRAGDEFVGTVAPEVHEPCTDGGIRAAT